MAAPTFWKQSTTEPKRAYRWFVTLSGIAGNTLESADGTFTGNSLTYAAKRVDKPSISISSSEHTFINHKFYYPGRVEWSDVSISFVDVVGAGSAADGILVALRAAGYNLPTDATTPNSADDAGSDNFTTVSKHSMVTALGGCVISQVNSEGNVVETWTLNNPWIKSISVGSLDYGSEELLSVDISLQYDWATYERPSTAEDVAEIAPDLAPGGKLWGS